MPTRSGSIKLFRLFGIDVYAHWGWFVALYVLPKLWNIHYSNYVWVLLEVLGLFALVLTHEFGHQLACRSVGGQTHDIVLWPLGGVAFVTPPQRPGAQLWSIVAGPLVNVVLTPILAGLYSLAYHLGWYDTHPDAYQLVHHIFRINLVLLIFNLVPIFPLDGGQILRSILWFPFGRANSLLAASIIGFIGLGGLLLLLLAGFLLSSPQDRFDFIWPGIMVAFIALNCWGGLREALILARIDKLPRRDGFACPSCKVHPPAGEYWRCSKCGKQFDTFLTNATCPHCGVQYNATQCLNCGQTSPLEAWKAEA